jgi:chemotaxis protein histidine kinase CheA
MIEDQALLNEYLSESEELLESLLADLDSLASRASSTPDINIINRIFRTGHSLKGLAGMMGLVEVQTLAHEFEDILDDLRLGQLKLNASSAAALQEAGAGLAARRAAAQAKTISNDFATCWPQSPSARARGATRIQPRVRCCSQNRSALR